MAEEELVDPKKYLEEDCKPKCVKPLIEYEIRKSSILLKSVYLTRFAGEMVKEARRASEACIKRIEGDDTGSKHCTGQYFDYFACIDKCVAPKLFAKLK